jgi:hypothetical protein
MKLLKEPLLHFAVASSSCIARGEEAEWQEIVTRLAQEIEAALRDRTAFAQSRPR